MGVRDTQAQGRPRGVARLVAIGAVCGLAWAAGFRAYMMEIAGPASRFEWFGTVGAILVPGAVVGALFGLAAAMSAAGRRTRIWWIVFAPLLFAIAPMLRPGALTDLFTTGLGGGAVGVALSQPRGVWATLLALSFVAVLMIATSIPLRDLTHHSDEPADLSARRRRGADRRGRAP